jgi:pilus assembly protein Flp/PilA
MTHQSGQGMLEYALIIALVALVAIGGLVIMGPGISHFFQELVASGL